MLIVITAGGVKEKIDNVRSITNSSSGKLGQKIAQSFLEKEPNCDLIYIYGEKRSRGHMEIIVKLVFITFI